MPVTCAGPGASRAARPRSRWPAGTSRHRHLRRAAVVRSASWGGGFGQALKRWSTLPNLPAYHLFEPCVVALEDCQEDCSKIAPLEATVRLRRCFWGKAESPHEQLQPLLQPLCLAMAATSTAPKSGQPCLTYLHAHLFRSRQGPDRWPWRQACRRSSRSLT